MGQTGIWQVITATLTAPAAIQVWQVFILLVLAALGTVLAMTQAALWLYHAWRDIVEYEALRLMQDYQALDRYTARQEQRAEWQELAERDQ